jgi:hypothetical protein
MLISVPRYPLDVISKLAFNTFAIADMLKNKATFMIKIQTPLVERIRLQRSLQTTILACFKNLSKKRKGFSVYITLFDNKFVIKAQITRGRIYHGESQSAEGQENKATCKKETLFFHPRNKSSASGLCGVTRLHRISPNASWIQIANICSCSHVAVA